MASNFRLPDKKGSTHCCKCVEVCESDMTSGPKWSTCNTSPLQKIVIVRESGTP